MHQGELRKAFSPKFVTGKNCLGAMSTGSGTGILPLRTQDDNTGTQSQLW